MKTIECEYQNVRLERLTRFSQDATLLVLLSVLNNIECTLFFSLRNFSTVCDHFSCPIKAATLKPPGPSVFIAKDTYVTKKLNFSRAVLAQRRI